MVFFLFTIFLSSLSVCSVEARSFRSVCVWNSCRRRMRVQRENAAISRSPPHTPHLPRHLTVRDRLILRLYPGSKALEEFCRHRSSVFPTWDSVYGRPDRGVIRIGRSRSEYITRRGVQHAAHLDPSRVYVRHKQSLSVLFRIMIPIDN